MIQLISVIQMAHFSFSSEGLFVALLLPLFFPGSVLSSTALSSENACHQFLCR